MPSPRSKRYKQSASSYMNEVGSYLDKVAAGRSVRKADPNQPAFSDDAEMIRQTDKINKANAYDRMMSVKP